MNTAFFALVGRQQVLDALRATGSRDADVLLATKEALIDPVRPLKTIGLWGYIVGGLLTALILPALLGIPLLLFSGWIRRRGKRNIETIELVFAEYLDFLRNENQPIRSMTS